MREITFRAWDKNQNKMVYDFEEEPLGIKCKTDDNRFYYSCLDNKGNLVVYPNVLEVV